MPTLATRLAATLSLLRAALAAHALRDVARIALFMPLCNRLGRLGTRFAALFARWQAGTLPKPRPPRARRPSRVRPDLPAIPRGRGWLLALPEITRVEVATTRYQTERLLADPQMADFLRAAPQAKRLLRPLCHMLGITASPDVPAALALPPPPRFRPQQPPPPPFLGIIDPPEVAPAYRSWARDRSGRAWSA